LGEAGGKEKPKTASMLKTLTVDTVTLEDAVRLLALPRHVGKDPESGEAITAQLGRYGPYLTRGKDTRSLEAEEAVFTVSLDEAVALFKTPKQRGQRKTAVALRTLAKDPNSGGEITVREGRFGLYVTDGDTNASLRKGDTLDGLTQERAEELLQERRERGPSQKKKVTKKKASKKVASSDDGGEETSGDENGAAPPKAKKAGSKKAPAKKAPKKASKKAAAKKAAKRADNKSAEKAADKEVVSVKPAAKKAASKKASAKKASTTSSKSKRPAKGDEEE
jgi:DNA topoisomerase-1